MHTPPVVPGGGRSRISAIALALLVTFLLAPSGVALAGEISGMAFTDLDRDAVFDGGEPALADQSIYVFDATGTYLANAATQADGRYVVGGLPDGEYLVQYASPSWWALRDEWVPTTTGSLYPRRTLTLAGSATADFGWRRIVRSTDVAAPISSYTGPTGLRVASYDDVVPARALHDRLALGSLGAEAASVTVRFDLGTGSSTSTSVGQSGGKYVNFAAICSIAYSTWLDEGDVALSHEYGHAWSLYHAYMTQQDAAFTGYLQARGIAGDPRLDTSYAWSVRELIAEDYRQLLGSPTAQASPQTNRELPAAADVTGLRDYLAGPFTTPSSDSASTAVPPPSISALAMNPDPVRSSGTAGFTLSAAGLVTVRILNAKGVPVRTLLDRASAGQGTTSVGWNRLNTTGQRVKRGTYQVAVEVVDGAGRVATALSSFSVI